MGPPSCCLPVAPASPGPSSASRSARLRMVWGRRVKPQLCASAPRARWRPSGRTPAPASFIQPVFWAPGTAARSGFCSTRERRRGFGSPGGGSLLPGGLPCGAPAGPASEQRASRPPRCCRRECFPPSPILSPLHPPVIPQVELGGKVSIPSAAPLLAGPGVSLQLLLAARTAEVGATLSSGGCVSRVSGKDY